MHIYEFKFCHRIGYIITVILIYPYRAKSRVLNQLINLFRYTATEKRNFTRSGLQTQIAAATRQGPNH